MGLFRRYQAKHAPKKLARPDESAPEPDVVSDDFAHASGHGSLRDVILEQAPNYTIESDVVRPRGRASRLHPDADPHQ